ncbi:MAG: hypothetical protein ACJAUH_000918 [Saprospiraceae bacterium]|jgi:hypothetical protein
MKDFRTILPFVSSAFEITHADKLLSIGSCFSENIGDQLLNNKFPIIVNPYGILFNPISIIQSLQQIINNKQFSESDIFYHNQHWQSFYHHGRFSNINKTTCLNNINNAITTSNQQVQNLDYLILTLGTANVFVHKESNQIVANCHKVPNSEFERKRLNVDEITTAFEPIFNQLKTINPKLKIIFTVSPVRHIRDGLVENQRSKATLLLAIDTLVAQYDFASYFPAYELVLDDLRDYRFFNADMIHPSKLAIDYVWNYFSEIYFSNKTKQIIHQIDKIIQAKNHRPFDEDSKMHQNFIQNQIDKIYQLKKQYSFLDFKMDLEWFDKRLK